MKRIIQQVEEASVTIPEENTTNVIKKWLLIYMAIHKNDYQEYKEKIKKFVKKIKTVKMLTWQKDKIDTSLEEINGEILLISNFTLYWRNIKSYSIDYTHSAPYDTAQAIYNHCIEEMKNENLQVKTWKFWAKMIIKSTVSGPLNYIREY